MDWNRVHEWAENNITQLVVYIDDIVIIRNDAIVYSLKIFLQGQFHTKDLRTQKYV